MKSASGAAKIHVGTSGWMYKDWHDAFYPEDVPKAALLEYYSRQFTSVEINATFYRLATANAVKNWREKIAGDFVYSVKGGRFITHMKRLTDPELALQRFFERIEPLQSRLGPILWQLPPTLSRDTDLLKTFVGHLPLRYRHAIEFRHPSWLRADVFDVLQKYDIAQVWISSLAMPRRFDVTTDFIYLRFHGLEQGYRHNYTRDELSPWAHQLLTRSKQGLRAFVYFNNDGNARAPENAKLLREMLGKHACLPSVE